MNIYLQLKNKTLNRIASGQTFAMTRVLYCERHCELANAERCFEESAEPTIVKQSINNQCSGLLHFVRKDERFIF